MIHFITRRWIASIFILVLFTALYTAINVFYIGDRAPSSPDEAQVVFFSGNIAQNYSLGYLNSLNSQYAPIFGGRQFVQRGDTSYPSGFLGFIIYVGILRAVNDNLLSIANPLLAALALLFLFKLTQSLFNNQAAFISILLLGFFPPFFYWTSTYFNNIAELTFLLGALYYLTKAFKEQGIAYYIVSSIFFSLVVWIRYTDLLFVPIIYLLFIVAYWTKTKLSALVFCGFIITIFIFPLLVLNNKYFGSPFTIGQYSPDQLVYNLALPDAPKEKLRFVPFRDFSILFTNGRDYIILFLPILFTTFILGVFKTRSLNKSRFREKVVLIGIGALWCLYYLGGIYFGYGSESSLTSGYIRYLLIVYAIMVIFSSYFISSLGNNYLKTSVLVITVVVFISYLFNSNYGLSSYKMQVNSGYKWRQEVLRNIDPNAVIFVKGADKILYPNRNVALYQMFNEKYGNETGVSKTIALMRRLIDDGHQVYILKEDNFYTGINLDQYILKLGDQNLKVSDIDEKIGTYRIAPI